VWNGR
jgi:hypothetical protein